MWGLVALGGFSVDKTPWGSGPNPLANCPDLTMPMDLPVVAMGTVVERLWLASIPWDSLWLRRWYISSRSWMECSDSVTMVRNQTQRLVATMCSATHFENITTPVLLFTVNWMYRGSVIFFDTHTHLHIHTETHTHKTLTTKLCPNNTNEYQRVPRSPFKTISSRIPFTFPSCYTSSISSNELWALQKEKNISEKSCVVPCYISGRWSQ